MGTERSSLNIISSLLLNAVTLIGGQFLARRSDRAILVFAVYVYMLMAVWIYFGIVATEGMANGIDSLLDIYKDVVTVSMYGLVVIWFGSMLTLAMDLFKTDCQQTLVKTFSGITGGVLLSLLSVVLMVYQFSTMLSVNQLDSFVSNSEGGKGKISFSKKRFYSNIYFGEKFDGTTRHGKPKVGDGYLQGRVTFQREPAKKVKLSIKLNNKFEITGLETDEDGIFTVRVEPGEWYVNRINTTSWEGMPDGDFLIVSGLEKNYKSRNYSRRDYRNEKGLLVNVTEEQGEPSINIEIRPVVELVWPGSVSDEGALKADVQADVIEWRSIENASKYLVEISTITHDGDSKSWSTTYHATTTSPKLPLSDVKTVPSDGQGQEYIVEVSAFTEDGRFITETNHSYIDKIFTLGDGLVIVNEDISDFLDSSFTGDDYRTARRENEKAKAIKVLIREGMYSEANELLRVLSDEKVDPGEKPALKGYLAASTGKCDEANKLFTTAKSIGGKSCVPNEYYVDCNK